MKKIVIALFAFFPIFTYGENMCVKDGSVMVILDPNIAGTTSSYDSTSATWTVQFSYGVVTGIGGCGAGGAAAGTVVTSDVTASSGYCRCKMLRPVESKWIASASGGWTNTTGCPSACATDVKNNLNVRKGMFGNPVQ